MGEGLHLPEEFCDLPLKILGPSTRRLLSIHLDPPSVIPSSNGVLGDMSGLAELAGFEFCHIRYFETKQSRTIACLEEWSSRKSATIGNMVKNLITMERFDCLSEIKDSILRDISKHVERTTQVEEKKIGKGSIYDKETRIPKDATENNLEVMKNNKNIGYTRKNGYSNIPLNGNPDLSNIGNAEDGDSNINDNSDNGELNGKTKNTKLDSKTEIYSEEIRNMKSMNVPLERVNLNQPISENVSESSQHSISLPTISENDFLLTTHDRKGQLKTYTACICCADEDLILANTVIQKYKKEHDADFFLPQEALLSGQYEFESLAEVIETRCDSRLLVILSKHYVNSPACVFATQFVKTLDPAAKCRKIIPVLLDEDVQYPRVLRGISSIKARRLSFGKGFWNLLSSSLRLPPITDIESELIQPNTDTKSNMNRLNEEPSAVQKENIVQKKQSTRKPMKRMAKATSFEIEVNVNSMENGERESVLEESMSFDEGIAGCASGTVRNKSTSDKSTAIGSKKKYPGLGTLRRIMKSLNIIERKPKLQLNKRSHSTGEAMDTSCENISVEPRSHSAVSPPTGFLDTIQPGDLLEISQRLNIFHAESECTLKHDSSFTGFSECYSSNNLSRDDLDKSCNDEFVKNVTEEKCDSGIDMGFNVGQNILSPNIELDSLKEISNDINELEPPSRQISSENNNSTNSRNSFDNESLLSQITSSDNNSIIMPNRHSFDGHSIASSFKQYFGSNSNSQRTSFESNSRQASLDGTSLTSVEDNIMADKHSNKCCWNEEQIVNSLSGRKRSDVMFEIML